MSESETSPEVQTPLSIDEFYTLVRMSAHGNTNASEEAHAFLVKFPELAESYSAEVRARLEAEKKANPEIVQSFDFPNRKQQLASIELLAKTAEEIGLSNDIFLMGGYVLEATGLEVARGHKDVDFIMVGQSTAAAIDKRLKNVKAYGESPPIEGQSLMTLRPMDTKFAEIDFWWVEKQVLNGIPCATYTLDPKVQQEIGRPLGLPQSAFSEGSISVGESKIKYIRPELIVLSLGDELAKERGINIADIDLDLMNKIKSDIEQSGLMVHF